MNKYCHSGYLMEEHWQSEVVLQLNTLLFLNQWIKPMLNKSTLWYQYLLQQKVSLCICTITVWVRSFVHGQIVKSLITLDPHIYSCPMKTHHCSDAHICGLSKTVQNCVIYNYYLGQMRCFRTNFNTSDSVNTWRNVSLKNVLIAFWAYTKRPKNLF